MNIITQYLSFLLFILLSTFSPAIAAAAPPPPKLSIFVLLNTLSAKELALLGHYVKVIPLDVSLVNPPENGKPLMIARGLKDPNIPINKLFFVTENDLPDGKTNAFSFNYTFYSESSDRFSSLFFGDSRVVFLDPKLFESIFDPDVLGDGEFSIKGNSIPLRTGNGKMTYQEAQGSFTHSDLATQNGLWGEHVLAITELREKTSEANGSGEVNTGLLLRTSNPLRPATLYFLATSEQPEGKILMEKVLWFNFYRTIPPMKPDGSGVLFEKNFLYDYLGNFARNLAKNVAKMVANKIIHGSPHESNLGLNGEHLDFGTMTVNEMIRPYRQEDQLLYQTVAFRDYITFMLFVLGIKNDLMIPKDHIPQNIVNSMAEFPYLQHLGRTIFTFPSGVKTNIDQAINFATSQV